MIEILLVFAWGAALCLVAAIADAVSHWRSIAKANREKWRDRS